MRRATACTTACAATWLVLACSAGQYDLQISQAVSDPSARWAQFAQQYGSLPGVYAIAAATAACTFSRRLSASRNTAAQAAFNVLCATTLVMGAAMSAYRVANYLPPHWVWGVQLVLVFALTTGLHRTGTRLDLSSPAQRASRVITAVGVSSWIVVYALKPAWGRVRFRDLQTAGANFSAWYLPQGITGHLSFPSGHAAMSWVLLPCLLLWRPRSLAFWLAAALLVGWGLFVAASRVVIGAHYFTDVLFSTAFTLGCTCHFVFQTKADSAQPIQLDSLRG